MSLRRILFLCTGNTCRSPMAEALFCHMLVHENMVDVQVVSRGLAAVAGRPVSKVAQEALGQAGIDLKDRAAAPLTEADVQQADLILVMEKGHLDAMKDEYPGAVAKTFLLKEYTHEVLSGSNEIQDPIGGTLADYERCRKELQDCLLGLIRRLQLQEGRP